MRWTAAGLAMSVLGENLGRGFRTIGPGGVGQSLLTTLINDAISPTHGYVDCDASRWRTQQTLHHIAGYCVLTGTDEAGGCAENFRNIGHCRYREIGAGAPMLCRPVYAKTNNMLSTRRAMSLQKNQAPSFQNAHEGIWDIAYQRSLMIKMKSAILPAGEYAAIHGEIKDTTGLSDTGGNITRFLDGRKADGAFFRVIYSFTNLYTVGGSRQMVDSYARNKGTTWAVLRKACGLGEVVSPTSDDGVLFKERWACARERPTGLAVIHRSMLFNVYRRYRLCLHYRCIQM